jgi:hypothetical protein
MTTFIRFSRAVVGLASGYAIAMAPGSAVAEQPDAAWAPSSEVDELLQWHSGLSVESNVCVAPQRQSAFTSRKPPEMAALLALHGAAGTWDVMQAAAPVSTGYRSRSEHAATR